MSKKVVVGVSGGVDSSVACKLLMDQGYEVIGVTFLFTENAEAIDAKKVCDTLGIEHHVLDYRDTFKKEVIDKFINDYKSGITPNPCILCNRNVKIKFLYDEMIKLNADFIATGHYAVLKDGHLYKSSNEFKDQSYFLCEVPKYILDKLIFPLEGMDKENVRNIARSIDLVTADKKDSLDVCFINKTFNEYISENIKQESGDVINVETNEVVGKHKGLAYYTIGQRRGLDIGGNPDRMFVVGKDLDKNILYVCCGNEDYLISDECLVTDINYLADSKEITNLCAKFRYHQKDIPVTIEWINDDNLLVKYPEGIKRVTPGQACVLYNGDECLGGGIIKEVMKDGKKLWYL